MKVKTMKEPFLSIRKLNQGEQKKQAQSPLQYIEREVREYFGKREQDLAITKKMIQTQKESLLKAVMGSSTTDYYTRFAESS